MTRVFDSEGRVQAVTQVAVLPAIVSTTKNTEKDGYKAVQIKALKNNDKSDKSRKNIAKIAEFRADNAGKYKNGEKVDASQFKKNDVVTVIGTAKGKGFAGTIKRHGFSRGPMSHGSNNHRQPGSIGGGYPQRVVLGRKMGGRMGGDQVTIKNLKVIDIEDDLLLISGAIPGPAKGIIKVIGTGEKAEEIIDHSAEEERLAQEKMMEADAEAKEEKKEAGEHAQPEAEKTEEKKEEQAAE